MRTSCAQVGWRSQRFEALATNSRANFLLLLWDHYSDRYRDDLECGDPDSPVQIECGLRGEESPPIRNDFPRVSGRLGIDLNPIDVNNRDSRCGYVH